MSTPHNSGTPGQFAKTVLMPGDPLRAKFIADTFLENAELITSVRNVYGYTGTYNGKKVSVMAYDKDSAFVIHQEVFQPDYAV